MFKLSNKVTPFLWYDNQAGDAAARYIALFGSGRVVHTQHWGEGTSYPAGSVMADLLARLDRPDEARAMWLRAADLTRNAREREMLLARAHNTPPEGGFS